MAVNPQVIKGSWNQIKGKLRERWGQVTEDELEEARGNADQLVGHCHWSAHAFEIDRCIREPAPEWQCTTIQEVMSCQPFDKGTPTNPTLWSFGLGFVLGWKVKIW